MNYCLIMIAEEMKLHKQNEDCIAKRASNLEQVIQLMSDLAAGRKGDCLVPIPITNIYELLVVVLTIICFLLATLKTVGSIKTVAVKARFRINYSFLYNIMYILKKSKCILL